MHTFPRYATAFTAIAALAVLAGCSSSGPTDSDTADPDGSGSGSSGETLIVYTNSNGEGRAEWLTEQAAAAGFDIEIVGQGGGDTTNKIIAEAGNPVADVVFGLNHMYFQQLIEADTIEPYTPSWAEDVDAELGDPSGEGYYWPLVQQAITLVYDADVYSEDDAPTDWLDLWNDERFHDRYEAASELGGATTQVVLSGILSRYLDESGDLGVSDEGWEQIAKYFEYGNPAIVDTDLFARMADGEVEMGQMAAAGIAPREEQYGVDAEIVRPSVGVPYVIEQVAIVKGSSKVEEAQKFIDWFGAADLQGDWAEEFGSVPVNRDALARADEDIVELHEGLERQDMDWELIAEMLPSWVEKIQLELMP